MPNQKSIMLFFALGIISLFLVTEHNLFFDEHDLLESRTEREFEEELRESARTNDFESAFTDFGGGDFLDFQPQKFFCHRAKDAFRTTLQTSSKRCDRHSLVILYCCLKIAFC